MAFFEPYDKALAAKVRELSISGTLAWRGAKPRSKGWYDFAGQLVQVKPNDHGFVAKDGTGGYGPIDLLKLFEPPQPFMPLLQTLDDAAAAIQAQANPPTIELPQPGRFDIREPVNWGPWYSGPQSFANLSAAIQAGLYLDTKRNMIFSMRNAAGSLVGTEIIGTQQREFFGYAPGSDLRAGFFRFGIGDPVVTLHGVAALTCPLPGQIISLGLRETLSVTPKTRALRELLGDETPPISVWCGAHSGILCEQLERAGFAAEALSLNKTTVTNYNKGAHEHLSYAPSPP